MFCMLVPIGFEGTKEEFKSNTIILHIQIKKRLPVCPKCGKRHLVKNGYRFRDFIGLPGHYFIHAGTSGPVTVPHRLINSEHFSRFVFQNKNFSPLMPINCLINCPINSVQFVFNS